MVHLGPPTVLLRPFLRTCSERFCDEFAPQARLSFPATGPRDPGTDFKAPGSLTHHRFDGGDSALVIGF